MNQPQPFPEIYYQIVEQLKPSGAYLVGGAVRDVLLGREIHDLDFALPADTIGFARRVADQLGGAFFILDQERETARVILEEDDGRDWVVDFTLFQGEGIEGDLLARDFTITSLAIDILDPSQVVDPCRGAQDLKDGLIRLTSPDSLTVDPLRCLRAVRLGAQLGFQILPETKDAIRKDQAGLSKVSPERIRDELFRVLAGPNQAGTLSVLSQLGTYSMLLPGDFSANKLRLTRSLEGFWSLFLGQHDQESAASWALGLLVHRLGRFREQIREYLDQAAVRGRTIYQLSFLTGLTLPFWDDPENGAEIEIDLSNQEQDFLRRSSLAAEIFSAGPQDRDPPDKLEIYRFFKSCGAAGVAGIFQGLAYLIDPSSPVEDRSWTGSLDRARSYLEGWWEKQGELINPPLLLNGSDLQRIFGLKPGPQIGELLEELREAQIDPGLSSIAAAEEFIGSRLGPGKGGG